jgi:hypothetical protein
MVAVLFWIAFSAGIAYFARGRGRGPIKWFAISLLISPLIAFIVLSVLENESPSPSSDQPSIEKLNGQPEDIGTEVKRAEPLTVEEFSKKVDNYKELRETDMIDEQEFEDVKSKLLEGLTNGMEGDSTEEVLFEVREMRDNGLLSEEDVQKIKSEVL